ncbi:MAG: ribonuclease III [Clostridia bacterium]|nr:ribonuclease III [Clostridia bacterium]
MTDEYNRLLAELENKIGYEFKNIDLLKTALTHSSYANESGHKEKFNERLEFLGDSVLGMIVAEYFFKERSDLPEGELTRMRAAMVCEKSLFGFATDIDLGKYLRLGKGELNSGGNKRPSLLSDAFEAVIAAVYLDGGQDEARRFVLDFVRRSDVRETVSLDYKSHLQQIVQESPGELLEYYVVGEKGPAHDRTFMVELRLNSNVIATGEGRSKKQAEQAAAKEALLLMGISL